MLVLKTAKKLLATIVAGSMIITPTVLGAAEVKQQPKVQAQPKSHFDRNQIRCIAENIYFEAGNQTERGMIAVTNVVFNRMNDAKDRFPDTPCAVIHQKYRGVCQFSWVCNKKRKIRNPEVFRRAMALAERAWAEGLVDVTRGSKFYHANYVNPNWKLAKMTRIGAHIFYNG